MSTERRVHTVWVPRLELRLMPHPETFWKLLWASVCSYCRQHGLDPYTAECCVPPGGALISSTVFAYGFALYWPPLGASDEPELQPEEAP